MRWLRTLVALIGVLMVLTPATPLKGFAYTLRVHDSFTGMSFLDALNGHTPDTTGPAWVSNGFYAGVSGDAKADIGTNYYLRGGYAVADDQYVDAEIGDVSFIQAVFVRGDSTFQNGYQCLWRPNIFADLYIREIVSGSYTDKATVTGLTGSSGDILQCKAEGTTITASVNGTLKATASSQTTYTSGSAGVYGHTSTGGQYFSVKIYDQASSGATFPAAIIARPIIKTHAQR